MTKDRHHCYIAAPLFTDGERQFNLRLAELLEPQFVVYLPQRDGILLRDLRQVDSDTAEARQRIYLADIQAIQECNLMIAVLDGPSIDDGVCFELGFATCLQKTCVGLTTDSRRVPGYFRNPMWESALSSLFYSTTELLEWSRAVFRPHLPTCSRR